MTKCKVLATLFSSVVALFFAATCYGQTPTVVGVGSSALFPTMAISATNPDPITNPGGSAYCGANLWTGTASGIDARSTLTTPNIPAEGGNLWVVWNGAADGSTATTICAYLSVDSIVGQRLFLGQGSGGNGTLSIPTSAETTAGANKVSFLLDTATSGLPSAIFSALNNSHFNVAFTDIRPEDGQFAYTRAACALISGDTSKSCMGYGIAGSNVGQAVLSSYSQTSAQVVNYAITGTDPISGVAIPAFKTTSVGADPVVILVNTAGTAAGSFSNINPTNANGRVLSAVFSGLVGQTADISGVVHGASTPIHVVEREPISGTYNTFEWQVIRAKDGNNSNSQELGNNPTPSQCFTPPATATYIPPTTACGNPMNDIGPANFRTRAIGTGEMVKALAAQNNPDSLGYAFFSLGNFGGTVKNSAGTSVPTTTYLKYLTLDSVDPLYASYSNGQLPACNGNINVVPPTFACTGGALPNFANVANGGYRAWSVLRAITYSSLSQSGAVTVAGLIAAAQDQAHVTLPDFLPFQYCSNPSCSSFTSGLSVFRSHYTVSGVTAHNGNSVSLPEAGGDMAGAIFYTQADIDFLNGAGNEFVGYIQ